MCVRVRACLQGDVHGAVQVQGARRAVCGARGAWGVVQVHGTLQVQVQGARRVAGVRGAWGARRRRIGAAHHATLLRCLVQHEFLAL